MTLDRSRWRKACRRCLAGVALLAAMTLPSAAQDPSLVEDMNPLLGPKYAQWMVGAVGQIASKSEREEFLYLRSDAEAQRFIDAFWQTPEHELIRQLFDRRAEEADRLFSEAGIAGRKTDRGTILILFGPPTKEEIEELRNVDDPDVLLWSYDRKAVGKGLNGEKPAKMYRFVKVGDFTRMFKKGDRLDPVEQRRRDPLRRPLRPY